MVTINSGTLTKRMKHVLESAYTAAGYNPDKYAVVTQGSFTGDVAASGSTHDGGGAADLRVWNLPSGASKDLYRVLVVALRERNGCAWYRDQSHGGMDPHIHVIVRDEPKLSSGARQQVADYDRGLNGLSNKGKDYHPRPAQHPVEWWDDQTPAPPDDQEDNDVLLIQQSGKNGVYLLAGNQLTLLANSTDRDNFKQAGVKLVVVSEGTMSAIAAGKD